MKGEYEVIYPEFKKFSSRLASFYYWPQQMKQSGNEMAEAVFFYTGQGDEVICFCCGLSRTGWCHFNKAWEEHAIGDIESDCEFLKEEKGLRFYRTAHYSAQLNEIRSTNPNLTSADLNPSTSLYAFPRAEEEKDKEEANADSDVESEDNYSPYNLRPRKKNNEI